jgi:hypothetical protein
MLSGSVKAPKSLSVDYEKIYGCSVSCACLQRFAPNPEPLCAGIDGVANRESAFLTQQDAVQQERLAGPVPASGSPSPSSRPRQREGNTFGAAEKE